MTVGPPSTTSTNENTNSEVLSGNANASEHITAAQPATNPPVAAGELQRMFLNAPSEFGLVALYRYNEALNEIEKIPQMPPQAQAKDFRALREFITRFIALVNDANIGMHYIEPVLLSRITASMNETALSVWSYVMRRERASLALLRSFLANEEEIAEERWIFANRFKAPSVSRAASSQSRDHPEVVNFGDSGSSGSAKGPHNSRMQLALAPTKKNENESTANGTGVANSAIATTPSERKRDASRSSDWQTVSHERKSKAAKNTPRSNSQAKAGGSETPNQWVCLGCGGPHGLFKCPAYKSKLRKKREAHVRRKGICKICVKSRHKWENCNEGYCKQCNEPHNSTLCPRNVETGSSDSETGEN